MMTYCDRPSNRDTALPGSKWKPSVIQNVVAIGTVPAHAVRGPNHFVHKGRTLALDTKQQARADASGIRRPWIHIPQAK
jgi:hypothetical protein